MRISPLCWFNTLKPTPLTDLGFTQSREDQCLFFHPELQAIVLVCVNDCLIFAPDDKTIDKIIVGLLKKHDLDEQEMARDVCGCLGIEINMSGNKVELLQKGITDET